MRNVSLYVSQKSPAPTSLASDQSRIRRLGLMLSKTVHRWDLFSAPAYPSETPDSAWNGRSMDDSLRGPRRPSESSRILRRSFHGYGDTLKERSNLTSFFAGGVLLSLGNPAAFWCG